MPRTQRNPNTYINQLKRQKAFAWGKYYRTLEESHNMVHGILSRVQDMVPKDEAGVKNIPTHLVKEIEDMVSELKKNMECPICMEVIEKGKLKITGCGHKYCETCIGQLKESSGKCAICRCTIK